MIRKFLPILLAVGFACAHGPGVARDQLAAGARAAQAGQLDTAASAYRKSIANDPSLLEAHRGYVEARFKLGKIRDTIAEYQQRTAERPGDAASSYGLGLALYAAGQHEAALASLRHAAELAPKEAELHHRVGIALLAAEQWEAARTAMARSVELAPKESRSYPGYAAALFRTGDRQGALRALGAMAQLQPTAKEVAQGRALLKRMNDPFRTFPEALKADLDTALQFLDVHDAPQPAIEILDEILRKYPQLSVAHALAGLAWQRLEEPSQAIEAFQRAATHAPDDPYPHLYLGELFASRSRSDRARAEFAAALARDPLSAQALRRDGELALEGADAPGAAARLKQLVALDPDDIPGRLQLAKALQLTGDMAGAEQALEIVVERDSRNVDALERLAELHTELAVATPDPALKKGHRSKARDLYQRVLDLQPENTAASRALRGLN